MTDISPPMGPRPAGMVISMRMLPLSKKILPFMGSGWRWLVMDMSAENCGNAGACAKAHAEKIANAMLMRRMVFMGLLSEKNAAEIYSMPGLRCQLSGFRKN